MEKISQFIVRYRKLILIAATLLLIPAVWAYMNTGANSQVCPAF